MLTYKILLRLLLNKLQQDSKIHQVKRGKLRNLRIRKIKKRKSFRMLYSLVSEGQQLKMKKRMIQIAMMERRRKRRRRIKRKRRIKRRANKKTFYNNSQLIKMTI